MRIKIAAPLRMWDGVFGWKRRREALATLQHAATWLTPGSTVLDIGCGMGYALEMLEHHFEAIPIGCDVVPSTDRIDRFIRFDGRRVPVADKSVDLAMLIFVLHHAEDPSILLQEASRVARHAILVVEDTPRAAFDRRWGELHIRSFNKRHNIPWQGRIRTEREWRQLFSVLGLPVRDASALKRFERLPPVARTAFILQPAMSRAGVSHQVKRSARRTTT